MEWGEIWDVIEKYWVQQLCVLVLAVITGVYRRQHKKFKQSVQDEQALKKAMMAQLRDRFYQGYKYHVQRGFYPIRDREVMQDIYNQYHRLGGNGVSLNVVYYVMCGIVWAEKQQIFCFFVSHNIYLRFVP